MACCSSCAEKRRIADSAESEVTVFSPSVKVDLEVLQQNANYISSQLLFVRKLGEIAEKLRFLPIHRRQHALASELRKLNLYLSEGNKRDRICAGDPMAFVTSLPEDVAEAEKGVKLNHCFGFAKVVHLPVNEGHVFRSKARTPVLLLMEVLRDVDTSATSGSGISNEESIVPENPSRCADANESRAGEEVKEVQNTASDANASIISIADGIQSCSIPHYIANVPPAPPRSPALATVPMAQQNSQRGWLNDFHLPFHAKLWRFSLFERLLLSYLANLCYEKYLRPLP